MHWIDILLLVWLAISFITGWRMGFIYKVASLIGLFASIYLATRLAPGVTDFFSMGWTGLIVTFLFLLSLFRCLFNLLAWLVDKAFHIVYVIPFTKMLNGACGAVLGVIITCLMIVAFFVVLSLTPWSDWATNILQESLAARLATYVFRFVTPFISNTYSDSISEMFLP